MDISRKLKDKRNRVLEREANELKDELCTMRHIVHLLDNIKRVSHDCISYLHLMVDAALRTDNTSLEQLRDDVRELEDELKLWERKYQMMSSMQSQPNIDNNHSAHNSNNNNNSSANEMNDMEGYDCPNGSYYDSDKNDDCAQSSSHTSLVLMPQELCEMSMETHDDQVIINSSQSHSTPPPTSASHLSSASVLSPSMLSANGKSLFECDWVGCDYRTNMRQRLVMHKRVHAGELLFSCDVPGCGYQSNYKGNIKIHKKHRHRIEDDKEYSTNANIATTNHQLMVKRNNTDTANCNTNNSNNSTHLNAVSNVTFANSVLRKRRRKKRFRYTMTRQNSGPKSVIVANNSRMRGVETAKEEITLFACNFDGCSYRSKWKQCLAAHILLHKGVKPYKCDYPGCNYSTNFKGNVNVHKRVHRENEFKCEVDGCKFATPWKNSFAQHQRNHFLNSAERLPEIDNHVDHFENSNENDFRNSFDGEGESSSNAGDIRVVRKEPVLPLIPVQQYIASSSTNNLIANDTSATNLAQQTLIPNIAVIKSEALPYVELE